jgi:hypothetical protein
VAGDVMETDPLNPPVDLEANGVRKQKTTGEGALQARYDREKMS